MKYFIYARKSSEDKNKQIASIDDQITEMKKLADQFNLEIVDIFQESKSAKKPSNREQFSLMVQKIHEGKADGIICWKLDRLARNPVDAGTIKWMLQQGVVQKIVTHGNEYKTGDNVLLMDMEFGIANQFILDLSKNTKRGLNGKAERGQFPSRAPIGYLNNKYEEKGNKTIVPDPEKFNIVRKVWDLALTGKHSFHEIARIAAEEYGLTGYNGKPIYRTVVYTILTNPFYYGNFRWGEKEYEGIHQPMITKAEFLKVQGFNSNKVKIDNTKKYYHPYTTTFTCGECGNFLTAENKKRQFKNGTEKNYIYYHCTNKRLTKCRQGSIELKSLEEQIVAKTRTLQLPKEILEYCLNYLREETLIDQEIQVKRIQQEQKNIARIEEKLTRLFDMRLEGELTSDDYVLRKTNLENEKDLISNKIKEIQSETQNDVYKDLEKTFLLNQEYEQALADANDEEKRFLIRQIGTKYQAKDGEIQIELKPTYKEVRLLINSIKSKYSVIEPKKALVEQGPFQGFEGIRPLMGD